jgi:hypothetical protein
MPVICVIFNKLQFIAIIAVDMIYWKTTLGKIVLDSDQLQAPIIKCIVESIYKIATEASWSIPPSIMGTFFHRNFL